MQINYTRILILLSLLGFTDRVFAQCEIVATALPQDITCGTCITLTAFGEGQGNSVFTENFNTGAPIGWQSTASATYTNPCDPGGVNGTPHLWMGDATGVPRQMTTNAFNFSAASAGATICFDMLFAEQGDASPCEGPDEPDEGVYLEYSINGGATWITINYFDPNGGNDPALVNWNNWCFPIPAAALTASTQIRWFQDNDSGADYDHWGLDNVNIYFNDPTFNITWQHDNYSYGVGNAGGPNPTQVCPQTTTTYTVTMTNGTTTCTDQVTVNVVPPVFRVNASPDTTICAGQCVDLNGEATIVVSPAKTPTYENSEISALAGLPSASDLVSLLLPCLSFGGCNCPDGSTVPFGATCPTTFTGSLSMNINITDLNTTTLQTGELTSICIGDALMVVGNLAPFNVILTCPSGASITLANAGDLSGTTLNNTCFDASSTMPVASGTSPYSGTFQPIDPLSNLTGCDANGVWTLTFEGQFNLASGTLPIGFLNGWEISFDDPEIIYTGIYSWSPTANMTNANTLSPTVCPTADQTYTLLVTDSSNCAVDSAEVTVNVINTNCCPFTIDYVSNPPSCGNADGNIDVTINNGSGNYGFVWSNGLPTTEDALNLVSGSYTLTVFDSTLACQKDTLITLLAPNSPVIDSIVASPSTCGLANGQAIVFASGGTGAYSYSLDGGTSSQISDIWPNLLGGNYVMTVIDNLGCTFDLSFQINSSEAVIIVDTVIIAPSCGADNGQILFTNVTGGIEPYQYSINNGLSFVSDSAFLDLSPGNYSLIVQDDVGCADTAQVSLISDPNAPGIVIDSILTQAPSCGANDGEIEIFIDLPLATTVYSINDGVSFQAGSIFTNLGAGNYQVLVTNSTGCQDSATVNLAPLNAPNIDSVVSMNPSCVGGDGAIEIFASGGILPLTFSIDNGVSFQSPSVFNNLSAGSYDIVVEDASGCLIFGQNVSLITPNLINFAAIAIVPSTCGENNGEIDILVNGGNAPLSYSIDNGLTFQANNEFDNLGSGTYTILVQEQGNPLCQIDSTVSILPSSAISLDSFEVQNESCFGENDGELTLYYSDGQAPYNVSLNGNTSNNPATNLVPDSYAVLVEDADGCLLEDTFVINAGTIIEVNTIADTILEENALVDLVTTVVGSSSGTYTWAPNINLSCADCQNPAATILEDVSYVVAFTDALTNCIGFDTVNLSMIVEDPYCLFPDAFSPNDDGVNDGFGGICEDLEFLELKIYNRWGELIYFSRDNTDNSKWDGTYKGKDAPLDVYVYVANMQFVNGKTETISGNFTLIK